MACGNINNPIPAVRHNSQSASNTPSQEAPHEDVAGLDMLAQQNGGQFDPVLFGDWREPQDAILSQDFGTFFDDAFPLPDLGSPSHNLTEAATQQPPKKDLIAEIDSKLDEEVVPGEDKSQMLSCTKIWYGHPVVLPNNHIRTDFLKGSSAINGEIPQRRARCRSSLLRTTHEGAVF